MKHLKIFTIGSILSLGSILFLSCSKSENNLAESDNVTIQATGAGTVNYTAKVTMSNNTFTPASVTVMQSGSILWVNNDQQVHTVTADDGSFDSGDIPAGGSFGLAFNVIGPHPYHCKYHPEMTGLVKCVTK
jgi:plastocyanin